MIRIMDVCFSAIGLILLSPLFLIVSIAILLESNGKVFYKQIRTGKDGVPFKLFKFRSMIPNAESKGLITIGEDSRITRIGKILRKYKLDELPQLINVLKGEMSLVGPRPEVPKYTRNYTEKQKYILSVKPGITDPASIFYRNESDVLSKAENPDDAYIKEVLPHKLSLSKAYVDHPTVKNYFKWILKTVQKLILG